MDALVADILGRCGYRFTIATDEEARMQAFRLRAQAVIEQGWSRADELPDGLEHDAYDEHRARSARRVAPHHSDDTRSLFNNRVQIETRGCDTEGFSTTSTPRFSCKESIAARAQPRAILYIACQLQRSFGRLGYRGTIAAVGHTSSSGPCPGF